ncbi:unnamed protein product, partial [Hapterophycus canaliculatus]
SNNTSGNESPSGSLPALGANPGDAGAMKDDPGSAALVLTGAVGVTIAHDGEEGEGTDDMGRVARGRAGIRCEGEDAWSCCGKTVVSAGRGCEPREPLATPEDLLLDTMDLRSRLGHPLDFRDYLPRTAWLGLSPDALHPFACSPSEGTLRPHTAPERLMDTAGRGAAQSKGRGEYDRRAARSRNGGLIGGVWASGGRRRRGDRGGLERAFSPSPDSGVNAWWKDEMADQRWGLSSNTSGRTSRGRGSGQGAGGVASSPKRHEFLLRSQPNATTATIAKSRSTSLSGGENPKIGRIPRPEGGGVTGGTAACAATFAGAARIDGSLPRTQILGMNGGRLPREVRQAPINRPLTAPCGKVGQRRVRTRGATRENNG